MAVTDDQYARILTRLTSVEQRVNDLCVAIDKFITVGQVNQLTVVLTAEVEDLRDTVDALEDRVTSIEEEPEL